MNIIQVCFTLKSGISMQTLKEKMLNLKERLVKEHGEDFEVRSCHLSRKLCISRNFSTDVPDLFEEVFGEKYVCELTEDTYNEAMSNMRQHREELSRKADRLVILEGENATNVALELELFTQKRVIVL